MRLEPTTQFSSYLDSISLPQGLPPPDMTPPPVEGAAEPSLDPDRFPLGEDGAVPSGPPPVLFASRLDKPDPHIAPATSVTPPLRAHSRSAGPDGAELVDGVLGRGVNSHSMAFHAGAGHPAGKGEAAAQSRDDKPVRDMRAAHRISDTERVRVGDVLVYGKDENGNGRIDKDSEVLTSAVVTEIDDKGRAVRMGGMLDSGVAVDHHPDQRADNPFGPELREWYRPRETDRQLAQRMNAVQRTLQADAPPGQKTSLDWYQDPHLAPIASGTEPPREHPGAAKVGYGGDAHNPHLYAWNNSGADPSPAKTPDGLYGTKPIEGAVKRAHVLREDEPAKVGDVLVYGRDLNRNDKLDAGEIERSAAVTQVDAQGRITRVVGQPGPHEHVVDHHPRQPTGSGQFEDPLTRTDVYRPKETPEQRVNRIDYVMKE